MKKIDKTNETKQKSMRLPDAELDVMLILWDAEKPLKVSHIMERLEGKREWSMSTLHVLLARMIDRGVIENTTEKNYKLYTPAISKDDYRQTETRTFLKKLYDNSAKRLLVSLIETDGISSEELDDIEKMLGERKKG